MSTITEELELYRYAARQHLIVRIAQLTQPRLSLVRGPEGFEGAEPEGKRAPRSTQEGQEEKGERGTP